MKEGELSLKKLVIWRAVFLKIGVLIMWKLNKDGVIAENSQTGKVARIELGRDGLYRVKKNYTTVGTFTEMTDAKNFLSDCVKKWNEEQNYEK